jgi:hypothetical protein
LRFVGEGGDFALRNGSSCFSPLFHGTFRAFGDGRGQFPLDLMLILFLIRLLIVLSRQPSSRNRIVEQSFVETLTTFRDNVTLEHEGFPYMSGPTPDSLTALAGPFSGSSSSSEKKEKRATAGGVFRASACRQSNIHTLLKFCSFRIF